MKPVIVEKIKLVRVHEGTYNELRNLKYEFRVDTFDEALKLLLQKHIEKAGAIA